MTAIPWWLKIAIKIILSRLPINYDQWSKLSIFQHGYMVDPYYAFEVAEKHYNRVHDLLGDDFVCMEIGPGDSLLSSLSMYALGSRETYLLDVDDFANKDMAIYLEMIDFLSSSHGVEIQEDIDKALSFDELLKSLNTHYLTEGIKSLSKIPDSSIDMIWSQAVLEHIKLNEFDEYMLELNRILKPKGVVSHRVDLKDHLSGSLNNLRFSEKNWESDFMSSSGFYTNRIRYEDMVLRFKKAGFNIRSINAEKWDSIPIKKKYLSAEYVTLSDQNLLVSGFDVVMTKF